MAAVVSEVALLAAVILRTIVAAVGRLPMATPRRSPKMHPRLHPIIIPCVTIRLVVVVALEAEDMVPATGTHQDMCRLQ